MSDLGSIPLLRAYTGNRIEGSNPFFSAIPTIKQFDRCLPSPVRRVWTRRLVAPMRETTENEAEGSLLVER
ncbi:hypothetical protein GCM10011390_41430 [Aureimonas endophytica]|uniref:Uncharacterized protein n=1 Tax=Aureimonas endophytica TaxID=2027858 RepID=A0A916ZXY6_9HYPH|nr:hypothetical protein GCM10011390_41430 [Aureimonas endophytica]